MAGFSLQGRSIKFKILSGFFLVVAIGAASSFYGVLSLNTVGGELKNIAEEDIPLSNRLSDITTKQLEQAVLFERALRLGRIEGSSTGREQELLRTEQEFIKLGEEINAGLKDFEARSGQALSVRNDSAGHDKFSRLLGSAKSISEQHGRYEKHAEDIFGMIKSGRTTEAETAAAVALAEEQKLDKEIEGVLHNIEQSTEKSATTAEEKERSAIVAMTSLTLVGVILGIVLGSLITVAITRPLAKAVEIAKRIAEGDLENNIEVTSRDETGQLLEALKSMSSSLTSIVTEVANSTSAIAEASSEISLGNASLSQRTEEQASSLEETASSMEEMTGTVKQNADSAAEAKQLADANRRRAAGGAEVVTRTVKAMGEINDSSNRIADIIGTIDGIAFQTNLLALNAAVEAARAGEQGRGFAVVASEVRSLAQRSAEAAKEIKGLIEDSVSKVKAGTQLVDESGKTLEEIIEGTQKVADIIAEIAAASIEQASGIDQVNNAVTQMDNMTQDNAALVEEAAAASRSMEEQANILMEQVSYFKLADSGNRLAGPSVSSTARISKSARSASERTHLDHLRKDKAVASKQDSSEWEQF